MTTHVDPLAPSERELAGGIRRASALGLVALSLIGTIASALLLRTGVFYASHPDASLACDVNPLIGCSSSLQAPEGHLFGVPNALVGTIGFALFLGIAIVLACGRRVPRLLWGLIGLGCLAGCVWIVWFLYLSVTTFRSLCPYCLVVWVVTIPLTCIVWSHLARTRRAGSPEGMRRILLQARWLIVIVVYAAIIATVAVGLADKVALVL
ncbi:hypothetical protein H8R18_06130 [Nanchangia anserum]|uniref:Vitamin K epoxide reductase domain-containing protein n=1 Tax=Nanchangia anserum TaxID=2692125 RepID=A0A8I0G777_9ACTO|nr:vitamin K epoxide reductase family protein [Nanchangia anserum]MBD3689115.1 hypothetical protein [Nanchangia anserum]QOX81350.1 hypothetical protein H8R18_06130 [Nanchangia anserum]